MAPRLLIVLDPEMSLRPRFREEGGRDDGYDDEYQRGSIHWSYTLTVINGGSWDMRNVCFYVEKDQIDAVPCPTSLCMLQCCVRVGGSSGHNKKWPEMFCPGFSDRTRPMTRRDQNENETACPFMSFSGLFSFNQFI